jgi:hypothetical protein
MPYRTFLDSAGTEWQVWDIVPRHTERRNLENTDRRVERRAIAFADRRREARRLADTRRAVLRGTYAFGWLCFESNSEKRRLSPIPPDWTACSEELLEDYLHQGQRVTGIHRAINDFSSEGPIAEAG